MKWTRGRDIVERLIAEGRLELISGAAADGEPWLKSAASLLESARREAARNPEASEAIEDAAIILNAAEQLLPQLSLYR